MLCHVCYGLLPTFPLLSSDDDEGGRERERKDLKRQFNEQVERTTRKDFRRRRVADAGTEGVFCLPNSRSGR